MPNREEISPETETQARDEETTVKAQKRQIEEEEEVHQEKRKKQRDSAKAYRKRKKEMQNQLLERIAGLEQEKKNLIERFEITKELVLELNNECKAQKALQLKEAAMVQLQLAQCVQALEQQVLYGAPEATLYNTIQHLKQLHNQSNTLSLSHLKLTLNPIILNKLIGIHFFEKSKCYFVSHLDKVGIPKMINSLVLEESISEEQSEKLDKVEHEHMLKCIEIRESRRQIIIDLKRIFEPHISRDKQSILEISPTIGCLRSALNEEAEQWSQSFNKILNILTPIQGAKLLSKSAILPDGLRFLSVFTQHLDQRWKTAAERLDTLI